MKDIDLYDVFLDVSGPGDEETHGLEQDFEFNHHHQELLDEGWYDTDVSEEDHLESTTNPTTTESANIKNLEVDNICNTSNIPYTESGYVLQEVEEMCEPRFPKRSNRGIQRKKYQPNLKGKTKYPISNYVSQHCLASQHVLLVEELTTVSIPKKCARCYKRQEMERSYERENGGITK